MNSNYFMCFFIDSQFRVRLIRKKRRNNSSWTTNNNHHRWISTVFSISIIHSTWRRIKENHGSPNLIYVIYPEKSHCWSSIKYVQFIEWFEYENSKKESTTRVALIRLNYLSSQYIYTNNYLYYHAWFVGTRQAFN